MTIDTLRVTRRADNVDLIMYRSTIALTHRVWPTVTKCGPVLHVCGSSRNKSRSVEIEKIEAIEVTPLF